MFCAKNRVELDPADDDAYGRVVAIAAGELDDINLIAEWLRSVAKPGTVT